MKASKLDTSGYLAQVVERALPTAPLLQRRQPSLFEPTQPWLGVRPQEVSDEPGAAPVQPAVRPSAPDMSPRWPVDFAVPPPVPAAPIGRAMAADVTAGPAPPTRPAPRAVTSEAALPREPPKIDATVGVVALTRPPRSGPVAAPAASTVATLAEAERRPDARRVAPPMPSAQPVPLAPRPVAATAQDRPQRPALPRAELPPALHRDRPAAAATAVAAPPPRPTATPGSAPRAALRVAALNAPRTAGLALPPPLPPVQVTIGRVEVRAVAPSAGTGRSARAAPRMSLDQYLRERSGGGR